MLPAFLAEAPRPWGQRVVGSASGKLQEVWPPELEDSPTPTAPRILQPPSGGWVLWLGACPHGTVAAPAQDTRTGVSDGRTSEALYFRWRTGSTEVPETPFYTLKL